MTARQKIVQRATGYPASDLVCLLLAYAWNSRSGVRGIRARVRVEFALGWPWSSCSGERGILTSLASLLERAPYAALYSRIQVRVHLTPILERERFAQLIGHALNTAGCTHTLLSDSGIEQLREASRGVPRQAGRILRNAMRLAVPKGLNHIPDDLLQRAIEEVR